MKKLRSILVSGALFGAVTAFPSQVIVVAEWNFNNFESTETFEGDGETIQADSGNGLLSVTGPTTGTNFRRDTGGGTTLGAWDGAPAGGSIDLRRGERWNNAHIDLSFSMDSLTDLNFSFAGDIDESFPELTDLQWSIDGGENFTTFATLSATTSGYQLFSYESNGHDFSALDNQSDVVIRFQFGDQNASGIGAGSGFKIDNIVVTAIPEPSTYAALFGLLALGCVAWRRRRR